MKEKLRALRKEVVKQRQKVDRSSRCLATERFRRGAAMTKIALVLAIVAIGEEQSRCIWSARCTWNVRTRRRCRLASPNRCQAPQAAAGATFIAVPTQPTVSPFTVEQKKGSPPPQAIAGRIVASGTPMVSSVIPAAAPDQERMREQMKASMERQQALLRDPEYREAMLAQQKMSERQANPNLARDLDLTAEQADRFFTALAERQLRSMETNSPMMWRTSPIRPRCRNSSAR